MTVDTNMIMLVYEYDCPKPGWRMFTLGEWLQVRHRSRWHVPAGNQLNTQSCPPAVEAIA